MRLSCESCGTEFSVEDSAAERGGRVRCPRCKHVQPLPGPAADATDAGARPPPGVPLTTPPGGKSQIGKLALRTRTVQRTADPAPLQEAELFGELAWEEESQLEWVVGRSNVAFEGASAAAPPQAPDPAPALSLGQSSVSMDWSEVRAEYDAAVAREAELASSVQADAWPESEVTDPWRRTPLPPPAPAPGPRATPSADAAPDARPGGPVPPVPAVARSGPPAAIPRDTRPGVARPPPGPAPGREGSAGGVPRTPVPPARPGAAAPTAAVPASPATRVPARTPVAAPPAPPAPLPAGPAPASGAERCGACGGPLSDADDLASGVCGGCRARAAAALRGGPVAAARPASAALTGDDEVPLFVDGEDVAPPRTRTPPPSGSARRRPLRAVAPGHGVRFGVLLALLAAAIAGTGVVLWLRFRPDPADIPIVRALPIRRPRPPPPSGALPEGLEPLLPAWQARPADPRPAGERVAEARAQLARDVPAAYEAAQALLEGVLAGEPRDTDALGLWLQEMALHRGSQLGAAELGRLLRLGDTALERLGRRPEVLLGVAELLETAGRTADLARARTLAQEAVDASRPPAPDPRAKGPPAPPPVPPPWSARARLTLASAYVRNSAALALTLVSEAEAADGSLRRVWNVRAAAQRAGGDPRAALSSLQKRLALDPGHARTQRELALTWAEVGEIQKARALYDALQSAPATQDGPAVVEMAALRARAERRPAEAQRLLGDALQRGRLTGAERTDAQVLLASVARTAGDLATAHAAAGAAVRLAADEPEPHLEALLVDLDREKPAEAAAHLPVLQQKLDDTALAALLEGRVRAAEARWPDAAAAFEHAVELDPRRTDARLWAAAAWAMAGNRDRALQAATPALEADPFRPGPGIPPLWPGDGVKGAADRLRRLSAADRDGTPLLAEAVVRFHAGDASAAEALVDRVLAAGGRRTEALAWKSLLAGQRGDRAGAAAVAREAVAGGRASGLAQYALGSALAAGGDLEGAKRALREAQTLAPALLSAQVLLAEVEGRTGSAASARERLRRVIVLDPEYAAARRDLYLLPPEE